jgi:predicted ATPase
MKIDYLQISNVLSFPYVADVTEAERLTFENGLNIIIGENGSGKSTALEVINFLFKRVLYKQYNVNQDLFSRRTVVTADERRQILQPANQNSFDGFRLEPNWDSESSPQLIRLAIRLDEIDRANIANIRDNYLKIRQSADQYSTHKIEDDGHNRELYILDVVLNKESRQFSVTFKDQTEDFGYRYLSEYNYFKEAISIHNFVNRADTIDPLYESFTLISSYRNYHAFQPSISLKEQHPAQQIQKIRSQDYAKSLNTSDQNEPAVFGLVRLRVAEKHFNLISGERSDEQCEAEANQLPFVVAINDKLKIVNLECKIRLVDLRTWAYSFEFFDLRRQKAISDINSLSAGQKAIIHLIFEAYGRGDLKGGVVIIDEPEVHLHYQFQHEYLQVIDDLNREQNCQYVLVTHSEALINSNTISNVRRFSLSEQGHTKIHSPTLSTAQKNLIKILDNTRSTYAFFAKKVVLVEGDTDRYFFRAIIQEKYPRKDQEIAILHMGGKGGYAEWKKLFADFGLAVACISDFDFIVDQHYPNERGTPLKTAQSISAFKVRNADWEQKINSEYGNNLYILKEGDLETYLGISKGLEPTIQFCRNDLISFLNDQTSSKSTEINWIIAQIVT